MDFARTLRDVREMRGLSQRQLSERCGFDPSYICLIESGQRVPSIAGLQKLAEVLDVPVSYLVFESEPVRGLTRKAHSQIRAAYQDAIYQGAKR